jgi:hypothetical protein
MWVHEPLLPNIVTLLITKKKHYVICDLFNDALSAASVGRMMDRTWENVI